MSATFPSIVSIERVADLLEEAAREIRALAGTSEIKLASLRGVEAQCDLPVNEPSALMDSIPSSPTPVAPTLLMTRREVADLLRIDARTLGRWRADPALRFPKPIHRARVLRWRRTAIERWLSARES